MIMTLYKSIYLLTYLLTYLLYVIQQSNLSVCPDFRMVCHLNLLLLLLHSFLLYFIQLFGYPATTV